MEFPQEFLHSYMFRGKYLLRGTFYCNEAIIHKNDPVRNIFGKIHLVGDDYHSDVFGCQVLDDLQDLAGELGVKGRGWLIEEQDVGVHAQGSGNGNSLLLSAGELVGVIVFFVGQAHFFQKLSCLGVDFFFVSFLDFNGGVNNIFDDGKMGEKIEVLEYQADFSIFDDFAGVRDFQTGGAAEQGGLAGTRRADDAEDLALVYFQGNVAEHIQSSEAFLYVFHFK